MGTGILNRVQPRQAFLDKIVLRRLELRRLLKRADVEMRQRHVGQAFASQGRSTPRAKSAPCLSWRGIELGDLPFGHAIGSRFECDEDRYWRAGMSSTTLAMTPIHAYRLTVRGKTDRAAQAAAVKLLGRYAHYLILGSLESPFQLANEH
jgi:hypothetical protein